MNDITMDLLANINRVCCDGSTASGFVLFGFGHWPPKIQRESEVPVEHLHAVYDYSDAVRYVAVHLCPQDASEIEASTGVVCAMTPAQFAALAQLLRLRYGPAREAARLVLVDGMRQAQAAHQVGMSPQGLWNACRRIRRGLELARVAVT